MQFRFCPCCATALAERPISGDAGVVSRLACPDAACGYVHWGNPIPAVGALVGHEGFFALVTGFLEAREDPRAAVVREVREELGLEVAETHLIGNYIFERK